MSDHRTFRAADRTSNDGCRCEQSVKSLPLKDYFILSIHDDEAGAHGNMGMQMSWWQLFLNTADMIAVIDSLLAGAFTGLLIYQLFASPLLPCLSAAIVLFLVVLVAHQRYQWVCWRRADRHLNVLFPSDERRQ